MVRTTNPFKTGGALLLVLGMAIALFGQAGKKAKDSPSTNNRPSLSVPNSFCPADNVVTGGQPSLSDLEQAAAQGYRTVVNLRRATEDFDPKAEKEKVQALGLKYVHIPVDKDHPREADAEAFLRVVRDPYNYPMFIHCGSANRVGGFWMIHRVLDDGWDLERAEKEARQIGLRSPTLKNFAVTYIETHKK